MKKLFIFVSLVLISVSLWGEDLKLTILHTNDIHGQCHSLDYNKEKNIGGWAVRASMINSFRQSAKNRVLLLEAGDISGRGEYETYYGEPEIKIMNYMKYDAMCLGNAEYKLDQRDSQRGPKAIDILHNTAKKAEFPVLCANVYSKETGKREFSPYIIIKEKNVRIAMVGMTSLKCRTYPETVNLEFTDPAEEWKKVLNELEGKYDFLIFISHLGDLPDMALAQLYPEIDLIIEGDYHTFLKNPIEIKRNDSRTLICQTGELGVALGRLDLVLDEKNNKIKNYSYKLIPVRNAKPDPNIEKILKDYTPLKGWKPIITKNWSF